MKSPLHIAVAQVGDEAYELEEPLTLAWLQDALGQARALAGCGAEFLVIDNVALAQGREGEAMDLLLRENPLPAITGRVCHHPCETACNRCSMDDAVAVHAVERALGDAALARTHPHLYLGLTAGREETTMAQFEAALALRRAFIVERAPAVRAELAAIPSS